MSPRRAERQLPSPVPRKKMKAPAARARPALSNQSEERRLGTRLQAVHDLSDFLLVLLFLIGRNPVGDDDHLILDRNEGNADRRWAVLVLALIEKLGGIECAGLKFVFFLGGIIEGHLVLIEHFDGVLDF